MPTYGLFGEDEFAPGASSTIFYSGADSIQSVRHLNSVREVLRLQKIVLNDREKRRRSSEAIALDFDAKLAAHQSKFSPKIREINILERCLTAVTISARDALLQPVSSKSDKIPDENLPKKTVVSAFVAPKPSTEVVSKPQLISSTPLPSSTSNFSFSNPSISALSPIPNVDNVPRFRESLATPLFKNTVPIKTVHSTPLVKPVVKPSATRVLHDAMSKSRLGSVEEEQPEAVNPSSDEFVRPTSTSVTPSSTRTPSPTENCTSTVQKETDDEEKSTVGSDEWSLSSAYYSDAMIELKSYLDDARMFEARSGITTRSLIKRSVLEKITVTSKRHASAGEKDSTCNFFALLLSMEEVVGFNNERFRLREKTSVHYAMTLIVEHYLSLLERDSSLTDTVAYVLYSLSTRCTTFPVFLIASLFTRSPCLDMNKSKCRSLVEGTLAEPDSYQDVMDRERAVCSLFYTLHLWSSKKPTKNPPFPLSSIWKILACTLNRAPILVATPFTLTELLKACGTELQSRYGKQMEKLTGVIEDKLLPQLERDVETKQESRRAGNSAYISALRSTIDLLIIS